MDSNVLFLIGFLVVFVMLYMVFAPENEITTGIGAVASGVGEVAGAAGAVAGGATKLGKSLFDKCPSGFKKIVGSQCRMDRPSMDAIRGSAYKGPKKKKNKKNCESGGHTCKYNGVGKGWSRLTCPSGYELRSVGMNKKCYQECKNVHPWSIPNKTKKKCMIDASNVELQDAKKQGISVNQLMVNKGYPAQPGYGDYTEKYYDMEYSDDSDDSDDEY